MKFSNTLKSNSILFCFLFLYACTSFSQVEEKRGYQIGGFFGASDYSGDLANNPLDFKTMSIGGGGYYGYYLGDGFQIRGRFTYQKIKGNDEDQRSTAARNLSFESNVLEVAAILSWEYESMALFEYRLRPNLYIGSGFYRFNPKAELNGQLIELQPLGTEGQGIPGFDSAYRLTDIVVPFGGGVKYLAQDNIMLELDISSKKVFTDYLDDVSGQEYVAPSILIQNGQNAVDLAYRADEIGGRPYIDFEDPAVRATNPRNISRKHDWYYLFSIGGSYYFRPGAGNEIKRNRKGVPNRYSRY